MVKVRGGGLYHFLVCGAPKLFLGDGALPPTKKIVRYHPPPFI